MFPHWSPKTKTQWTSVTFVVGRWRDATNLSFSAIYSSSSTHSLSLSPFSPNLPPPLAFISHHWHLTFSSLCPSFLHWCQFASCYLSLGLHGKAQGIFPFLFSSPFVFQIVLCFIYFNSYWYLLFTWILHEKCVYWRRLNLKLPRTIV